MFLNLFIGAKQISDMIHWLPLLDYVMLLWAILMFGFLFFKNKYYCNLLKKLTVIDYLVLVLGILNLFSFAKDISYFKTFVKIESCFLIYFLGRMCKKDELDKMGKVLAALSYTIIYANFFYRFYQFGFRLRVGPGEEAILNTGGFYYYKNDLAIGILYAMMFIFLYSKKNLLKWFTIFVTSGYMIIYSNARTEQPILILVWLMMIYFTLKKGNNGHKFLKKIVAICSGLALILLSLFFVFVQVLPLEQMQNNFLGDEMILEKIFHSRHVIWMDVLIYLKDTSFLTRLFGVDLGTEIFHTSTQMRLHSQYMKQFYSVGYLGSYIFTIFLIRAFLGICEEKNDKIKIIFWISWTIFLVAGIATESMMFTQISWIPMLITGMMISERENYETKD